MTNKIVALAGMAALSLGLGLMPGVAHAGFFEQLFGMAPQPAPQARTYDYSAPQLFENAPVRRRAKRVADDKPKLQKPTDIMHDATLQNGDVVVTEAGIEVYVGDDGDTKHAKADFQPLDDVSGMPKNEYKALVAMDTTRNDPLRGTLNPDTIASGRSASVASPITQGHDVVDPRGKTVRYVGP